MTALLDVLHLLLAFAAGYYLATKLARRDIEAARNGGGSWLTD